VANIFSCPVALVSLIDEDMLFFKSIAGEVDFCIQVYPQSIASSLGTVNYYANVLVLSNNLLYSHAV
jgi:hypothetical protein